MSIEIAISNLSKLSVSEQMRVVSAIWNKLPDDVSEILPSSEAALLEARLKKYEADPSDVVTEDELRQVLGERKSK